MSRKAPGNNKKSKKKDRSKKKSKQLQSQNQVVEDSSNKQLRKVDFEIEKCSTFMKIVNVTNIVQHYYEVKREREKNFEGENLAAIQIQRCFRGYLSRKDFLQKKNAAIMIQRVYRGYKYGKKIFKTAMKMQRDKERMDYYHKCASKIQALWRGYIYRKKVFSFYTRQEELRQIELKNVELSNYVNEKIRLNKEAKQIRMEEKRQKLLIKVAPKLHYLLSTKKIPGVLKTSSLHMTNQKNGKRWKSGRGKKMNKIMNETVFNDLPLEDVLKRTARKQLNIPVLSSSMDINMDMDTFDHVKLKKKKLQPLSRTMKNTKRMRGKKKKKGKSNRRNNNFSMEKRSTLPPIRVN